VKDSRIEQVLAPVLARFDLELEAVDVLPAGKRRLLRVVVDGDGPEGRGPLLDDIAEASREISRTLDAANLTGNGPYTLEVSSRGVNRPLTLPRHWRRNVGRLVEVRTAGGECLTGRIASAGPESATLEVDDARREQAYADVASAHVQVELNRPARDEVA
jgi:ribosome maturation factor RimP